MSTTKHEPLQLQVEDLLACAYAWADDGSDSFTPEVKNLITVAPELAYHLSNMIEWAERYAEVNDEPPGGSCRRDIARAKALLARARGEV